MALKLHYEDSSYRFMSFPHLSVTLVTRSSMKYNVDAQSNELQNKQIWLFLHLHMHPHLSACLRKCWQVLP